ncbi:thiolase family protein [Cryptosporangium aurantiacum]|uniref:Acetyl-CoA acetyltransferase n=1 Tax=Cryptosporangium aurantiacum TaxID=134849 RepID=A0A1M7PIU4_9ACTN|nr:thiolase family protein [Cryptosporangium aurantiacum]SHN17019.1 Acetyl-CoA acetyltransferase [Cryptosporangium aurantiacum]
MSAGAAIAGLGITPMGKIYGRTAADFGAEAIRLAVADAGLALSDVDGLLTNAGLASDVSLGLQRDLGLLNLRLLSEIQAYGSSAGAMVQYASMAVAAGMADVVACVFADAPLKEKVGGGAAYAGRGTRLKGWRGLTAASGILGANPMYALAARRHMLTYGTTSEQLGAIAVAQREWAVRNPLAQMRTPITLEDHQASRMIADPFHLFDCCLVSNGGVAVIVTSAERAADLRQPAVSVLGWGQSHPGYPMARGSEFGLVSGAAQSGPAALKMAGVTLADIDVVELYDCYTFTVLISLEDYGFCAKGEGGEFVAGGALGPNGPLKVNTGGGQLSSYYMWGMTPLSEAIIQARGQGGDRQADRHDLVLVSGNGGVLDHHSTLILGA